MIYIENETDILFDFDTEALVNDCVRSVCAHEQCSFDVDVSVIVTDAEDIRRINLEHRGIDETTDVLSFPMHDYAKPADFTELSAKMDAFDPDSGELLLGDIIINAEKVRQQAAEYGHTEYREFAFLMVHSLLHLFGYDHSYDAEAPDGEMERRQKEIMQPYVSNK
jgi:probable rRNA maturation factor